MMWKIILALILTFFLGWVLGTKTLFFVMALQAKKVLTKSEIKVFANLLDKIFD